MAKNLIKKIELIDSDIESLTKNLIYQLENTDIKFINLYQYYISFNELIKHKDILESKLISEYYDKN